MGVFDIDPGQNPQAFGTMSYGVEGQSPGMTLDSDGNMTLAGTLTASSVASGDGIILASNRAYGTVGSRAAFINALDAAEAAGKHTIVYIPTGVTIDVLTGLSMSGRSALIRGGGAGSRTATDGSWIKASTQTGPVLNFTGWVTPGQAQGKVTIGGFGIQGSNLADATKVNAGLQVDSIDSVTFSDIAIKNTGGPPLYISQSLPGDGCYLSDFERIILSQPVGVVTNDVPWMKVVSANCNRFRSFGFRALGTTNVGLSGAIVIDDDGTNPTESNFWEAFWFENMSVQPDGCLISVKAFKNVFADFEFIDVDKEGTTGTHSCYFLVKQGASNGGIEIRGVIPGGSRSSSDVEYGVRLQAPGNRITGTKGDGSNHVVVDSGKGGNYVELGGRNQGVNGTAFIDNSGLTTNTLIDYNTNTLTVPSAMVGTGGGGSGAAPVTTAFAYSASPQSYVIPAWAKSLRIRGQAPGGGGGSGARQPDGTACGGGGSGGGGAAFDLELPVSALTTTILIDVGAAGVGGAAVTTNATNGNPGTGSDVTTVRDSTGTIYYARATGGGGGGGGTTAGGTAGNPGTGQYAGAAGVAGAVTGNGDIGNTSAGGGAGGAGGGINAANTTFAAGLGGYSTAGSSFGYTPANTNGTATTPAGTARGGPGGGGGDPGSGTAVGAVAGTAGGNGGNYGSGGGGGGGSRNGNNSGKGGNGTTGYCTVTAY